jgi:hypothetical protein
MRINSFQILLGLLLAGISRASAQGTFQDLNFENANIVPNSEQLLDVANALPGWTVIYGDVQQAEIRYNALSLGGTAATLEAAGYPGSIAVLDGDFSLFLQGGSIEGVQTPVSISQTGQIPFGTQSLLFESPGANSLQVSIGNDNLTLFPVGSGIANDGQNYLVYGANVSAFSGRTEQLSFTAPGGSGAYLIDDISFSPNAVPEPSPIVLTGIGGLLFALYRRLATNGKC